MKDEDKPWVAESCGRRVMTTRNTDGRAYTLAEFIEYFKDHSIGTREWEKAAPVRDSVCHRMDQRSGPRPGTRVLEGPDESSDKTLSEIRKALIRLLDEDEARAAPLRRGFKQKNAKFPRCALVWARLVKTMLLLMHNDHRTGRFGSGRTAAIGESAGHL